MRADSWQEVQPGVFYNETSAWNKAFDWYGLYENIVEADFDKYQLLNSVDEVLNAPQAGVYYMEAFGSNQHKIWLRPFRAASFREKIYWSGPGGY